MRAGESSSGTFGCTLRHVQLVLSCSILLHPRGSGPRPEETRDAECSMPCNGHPAQPPGTNRGGPWSCRSGQTRRYGTSREFPRSLLPAAAAQAVVWFAPLRFPAGAACSSKAPLFRANVMGWLPVRVPRPCPVLEPGPRTVSRRRWTGGRWPLGSPLHRIGVHMHAPFLIVRRAAADGIRRLAGQSSRADGS